MCITKIARELLVVDNSIYVVLLIFPMKNVAFHTLSRWPLPCQRCAFCLYLTGRRKRWTDIDASPNFRLV